MSNKLSYIDDPEKEKFVVNRLMKNNNLTVWEKSFVENISSYINQGGFLSEKQKQTLSNIWEKY